MMTKEEMYQVASDTVDGKVAWEHLNPECFRTFIHLAVMGMNEEKRKEIMDMATCYEYIDKAGPRGFFLSGHFVSESEFKQISEFYTQIENKKKGIKDEILKGG